MKNHIPRFFGAAALAVAAAVAIQSGCSPDRKPANVVFITLDTFRGDHLGALSGGRAATPALDGLTARGILFENAWSPIPITLPAHKSIFFGQPPHALASYNNGQTVAARRDRPSFVQAFRKKGFVTAAFVSLGVLTREFGPAEGFDYYEDKFPAERWYLTADEVNRKVVPWLE
ncbi:MAG: sulfatase-like hydrolase/transferase, partial [Candidatus Aminicenantes bacterium]|nr:sulfatase-like hydrolase/transferase [Candidatus Aminicenantes bacterium]